MKSSSLLQIAKKVCVFGVVGYTFQDNFAQPWLLSESSMEPTYSDGDMVLMSSWNYSIKRGDVILLKAPLITKEAICKRVVALPGDTVDYKNEEKKIPEGHMWIEGDCKLKSLDSREYGPVPIGLMLGKVYWKFPWFSQNLFTVKTD